VCQHPLLTIGLGADARGVLAAAAAAATGASPGNASETTLFPFHHFMVRHCVMFQLLRATPGRNTACWLMAERTQYQQQQLTCISEVRWRVLATCLDLSASVSSGVLQYAEQSVLSLL
jgi:hypothetical protein